MRGSWSRLTAVMTVTAMLVLLWPQAAQESDALAAPELQVKEAEPLVMADVPVFGAMGKLGRSGAEKRGITEDPAIAAEADPVTVTEDVYEPAAEPKLEPELEPDSGQGSDIRADVVHPSFGTLANGVLPETEHTYVMPSQPTVYLTFDDGPSTWTPQVLDLLQKYEIPATFFVLGEQAENDEETVRRIVREGHALGNHSYDHEYKELYRNFDAFWEQAQRTNEILERITGESVSLLRAPGGTATNFDAFYFYYLEQAGFQVHDWNVDSGDSKRRGVPAEEIIANVKKAKLTHEMNVLLHDGAGHEETVKALPEIIRYFQEQGYRFAALNEQVNPIKFRIGKLKWNRHTDQETYEQMLALIDPNASTEQPLKVVSADVPGMPAAKPAKQWTAVREWAEREQVAVMWDPAAETATLNDNGNILLLNVRTGKASALDETGQVMTLHIDFVLKDQRIHILESQADVWKREGAGPFRSGTGTDQRLAASTNIGDGWEAHTKAG